MKRLILSILSLLAAFSVYAQAPQIKPLTPYQADMSKRGVIPFEKKGLWGYADVNGKTLIKPMFEAASPMDKYGLSVISFGGKKGLVGRNCCYILEPCYDEIGPFDSHKLSYVKNNGKVGLITINGKEVVPVEFDSIGEYNSEGFAFVEKDGKKGTINYKGEFLLPLTYDSVSDFNSNLYFVTQGSKKGLVDHSGKSVLPVVYDAIDLHGSGNFYILKKNGKYGVLTPGGVIHCDEAYEFIHPECFNDVIIVKKDGKMGAVNSEFGYKIVLFFDELAWPASSHDYLVNKDAATGKYGAITLEGKKILDCDFDAAPVLGDSPKLFFGAGRYLFASKNGSKSLSEADDELFKTRGSAYLYDSSIPQSAKKHLPNVDVNVGKNDKIVYKTEWSEFDGIRIGGCGLWNETAGVWKLRPVYECPDGDYMKCGDWSIGVFRNGRASVGYKGNYVTIDENANIIK